MYDIVHAICAPNSEDNLKNILKFWRDASDDAVPEFKPKRVEYGADGPKLPWGQATQLMFQQLAVMKKVKGHG